MWHRNVLHMEKNPKTAARAAGRESGIRGRLANVAKVTLLTGLSRRDVRRQRELIDARHALISATCISAAEIRRPGLFFALRECRTWRVHRCGSLPGRFEFALGRAQELFALD